MKILLINQPLRNRGDESAHKALLRELLNRIPTIQIRVLFIGCDSSYSIMQFDVNDSRVEYINIHPNFRFSKLCIEAVKDPKKQLMWLVHPTVLKTLSYYKWADMVLCAPGGICMGGFQDWKHLFFLKLAKFSKKPLAYFARSIGPFTVENPMAKRFRKVSNEMLHYFSFISLRDKKSEKIAEEFGVQYVSTIDSAFLDAPKVDLPYEIKSTLKNKQYMVFVPNYLLWHYKYKGRFTLDDLLDFYCKVIKLVWKRFPEMSIVMLPQTFDQGGLFDDVNLFRMIAERLDDSRIIVIPDCYSSDVQQTIISKANFVIGARYHSIVFAINQNIPFIALSYEHKISGLLETLDCMKYHVDFQEVMFANESKEQCLKEIENLIINISKNAMASEKAKYIARNGMSLFINQITKQ